MFPNFNFCARELMTQREECFQADIETLYDKWKERGWEEFMRTW